MLTRNASTDRAAISVSALAASAMMPAADASVGSEFKDLFSQQRSQSHFHSLFLLLTFFFLLPFSLFYPSRSLFLSLFACIIFVLLMCVRAGVLLWCVCESEFVRAQNKKQKKQKKNPRGAQFRHKPKPLEDFIASI